MEINIIAPINQLGYGQVGLHVTDELMKLGHRVALFPINTNNIEAHPRYHGMLQHAIGNKNTFDVNAPCIRIWHQNDMAQFVGKGKHIGFPIFELDTFTDLEKHHLRSCDQLFVCSEWAKNVVMDNLGRNYGNGGCEVVPLGVDLNVFYPSLSRRKPTVFLNVGKWEVRKGHDFLHNAFKIAFQDTDNVELWMMCDNPFCNQEQKEGWERLYNDHRIRLIPRVQTDEQVADVMRQADCGVFPSRGEGWNLEALEMLSCGKQLIVTDYSAHTEFCTKENSHLVSIGGVEPAQDGVWFHGQGNWAMIEDTSMNELIKHMQYVHKVKQEGGLELNKAGIETANKFSWTHTADSIISCL